MTTSPSSDVRNQARAWVLRMADADAGPEDQSAFRDWYDAAHEHAAAYERELNFHYALGPLQARFADEPRERPRVRWSRPATAAAGTALAAGLALFLLAPSEPAPDWRPPVATQLAEVHEMTLPDGTIITLGPETRFQTAFSDSERRVRLTSGEAYFVIAQDEARPFVVEAQGALIRDIGTEFEVKTTDAGVRVTVAEGIVDITEPPRVANLIGGARVHRLIAGEQLSITSTALAVQTLSATAPARPAAWREGFLIYENATLAEVVADANRYSATPIRIMDPALGDLRVTTAYRTDQISQMLSIVGATMPIQVVRTDSEVRLEAHP
jgi:transmembrane sensor